MGKREDIALPVAQLIGHKCHTCLRKKLMVEDKYICRGFNRFYFEENEPDCGSFIDDAVLYFKQMQQMIDYYNINGGMAGTKIPNQVKDDYEHAKGLAQRQDRADIRQAYFQDVHRGHGGGGSESDSNNKTSMKQKMKDNRYKEPWGAQDVKKGKKK